MKNSVIILACLLCLLGCGSREPQQSAASIGFTGGSDREAVVKQLEAIRATILKDSPELLHAEFRAPELKKPMQVELGFADGKLASVNYIPQ